MLHLRQRLILPLLRAGAAHIHSSSSSAAASLRLSRILLSTAAKSAAAAIPFTAEEYLVATCCLTGDQARNASAKISHLKSASNPDAVLALLSGVGLSRADIAAVVAAEPRILCGKADNIARRIASLRDRVGLSDPQIGSLLLSGGAKGLRKCDVASRVEFWIPFLGSFEMLLKMVKANYVILTSDVEKVIRPNIVLLQECGLTVCDIVKMPYLSRLLTTNPKRVESSVQRADVVGIPRSSGRFKYMLASTCRISEDRATARMKFLSSTLSCSMDKIHDIVCKYPAVLGYSRQNVRGKIDYLSGTLGCSMDIICDIVCKCPTILGSSQENLCCKIEFLATTLGCSQEKIYAAVYKKPQILGLSDDNLRRKINFMITEVGLEPKYIMESPILLTYSLEKRLVPRHSVITILRAMGLIKEDVSFKQLLTYCEKDFIARYIDPYKQEAPTIADAYASACTGKMSDEVHL